MADDVQISNYGISYDLNLLGTNFEYRRKLKVSIEISIATTNM